MLNRTLRRLAPALLALTIQAGCSPEPPLEERILELERQERWLIAERDRQLRDAQIDLLRDESFRKQLRELDQPTQEYDAIAAISDDANKAAIQALDNDLADLQQRLAELKTQRQVLR